MKNDLHLVCPHCKSINRVPTAKLSEHPNCGRCQQPLFTGEPIELTTATFSRHVERSDLLLHRAGRRLTQRNHRDHGSDADDDAERRQERAQQMAADRAKRENEGGAEHARYPFRRCAETAR